MHFRTGVRLLIQAEVDASTVIAPGDLLYLQSGKAYPAASYPWTTDLATTQAAFAADFLGLAYSGTQAGDEEPVSVDVSPLSFYDAESVTPLTAIGAPLAPTGFGLALSNQVLDFVTTPDEAIGRLVKTSAAGQNRLGASFASAHFTATANANAAIG